MDTHWPYLVGRGDLYRQLSTQMQRLDCRGFVLAGEPGVGKTRLGDVLLTSAESAGARTLRVVASAATREVPLGAFAGLLASTDEDAMSVTTAAVIRAVARRSLRWLLIDDAHLLDMMSLAVLQQLVINRVTGVIVTVRTGEPVADTLTSLWKDRHLERIDMLPLTATQTLELMEAVLDGPLHRDDAHRLWRVTHGNPLYLRLLVEGEQSAGRFRSVDGLWKWTGTPRLGPGLRDLVALRLTAVAQPVRELMELLAVAEPLPVAVLADLIDADVVEAAERSGLVEVDAATLDTHLSHPLFGEVLRTEVGVVSARRYRGRVVRALTGRHSESLGALRLAVLAVASDVPADPALFTMGAMQANAIGDFQLGFRLAREAVAAGGGFDAQREIVQAAFLVADRPTTDAEYQALLDLAATSDERIEAAVIRLNQLTLFDPRPEDEAAFWEQAWRNADHDHRLHSVLQAFSAYLDVMRLGPRFGLPASNEVLADTAAPDAAVLFAIVAKVLGESLAGRADSAGPLIERADDLLERMPSEVTMRGASLTAGRLYGLLACGRLEHADAVIDGYRARSFGDEGRVLVRYFEGWAALAAGRLRTAERLLREALAAVEPYGDVGGWRFVIGFLLTTALARLGRAEEARGEFAGLQTHRIPVVAFFDPWTMIAEALVLDAEGATSVAMDVALAAADTAHDTGAAGLELEALEVAVLLGVTGLTARLEELAAVVDGPRGELLARHARALDRRDPNGLVALSIEWEQLGDLVAAATAAAQAAEFPEASRQTAARAAARARSLVEQCGAAATPALRQLVLPLPLTRREREIVELVAHGLSNREIAERLFISVRTAEGHVLRATMKLGVDRAGIADLLNQQRTSGDRDR